MTKARTRADGFALEDLSSLDNGILSWDDTNGEWVANSDIVIINPNNTDTSTTLEIGSKTLSADTPSEILFHTSSDANNYDSKIRTDFGDSTDGNGKIELHAAIVEVKSFATSAFPTFQITSNTAAKTGPCMRIVTDTVAGTGFNFLECNADQSNTIDLKFRLSGDGNGTCDGAWTGGGADYAEWFEWDDGNPDDEDRVGCSVVLVNEGRIRQAKSYEEPMGVVSGNPAAVGNAAELSWHRKFLRDEFNRYVYEDGELVFNPDYDPEIEYTPRSKRKEWACVGLLGKLRIRKGQTVHGKWIRIKDITEDVSEWLIR